jgi:hypothetical protein
MIEHHHTIKELPVVFKLQSSLGLVQQAETVIVAYQATLKLKNISNAHQLISRKLITDLYQSGSPT